MNGVFFRIVPNLQVPEFTETLPLKQQIASGVLPEEIKCKEGFDLVFKITNNMPACVKPLTVEKLIERGWAMDKN